MPRFTKRQNLVIRLARAALELEETEEKVKGLGGTADRMLMVEAYDRYRDLEQEAIKVFNNIEQLQKCIAAGTIFLNFLEELS